MKLESVLWEDLEPYLRKARGQSNLSVAGYKGKFGVMKEWFDTREFDDKSLSVFLSYIESLGLSPATQDNYLKLAKHISHYAGLKNLFDDFHYIAVDGSEPEYICSKKEITKMAEVKIKYLRYSNRKKQYPCLVLLLGNVGSRINETLRLEWRDIIESEIPMIHFRKEIVKGGKNERYCPIPKWLYRKILELPREDKLIFSKVDVANFRKDLKLRAKLANVFYPVKPHTLRDSSINNKLEYGMPLEKVADYHGHAHIDTTWRYYVKIQAKQLAQSLKQYDPAFVEDQTYEDCVQAGKTNSEKVVNPKVCEFVTKTLTNPQNKKEYWIGFIER